jgi:hypothetical protein
MEPSNLFGSPKPLVFGNAGIPPSIPISAKRKKRRNSSSLGSDEEDKFSDSFDEDIGPVEDFGLGEDDELAIDEQILDENLILQQLKEDALNSKSSKKLELLEKVMQAKRKKFVLKSNLPPEFDNEPEGEESEEDDFDKLEEMKRHDGRLVKNDWDIEWEEDEKMDEEEEDQKMQEEIEEDYKTVDEVKEIDLPSEKESEKESEKASERVSEKEEQKYDAVMEDSEDLNEDFLSKLPKLIICR